MRRRRMPRRPRPSGWRSSERSCDPGSWGPPGLFVWARVAGGWGHSTLSDGARITESRVVIAGRTLHPLAAPGGPGRVRSHHRHHFFSPCRRVEAACSRTPGGRSPMLAFVRAGLAAALLAAFSFPAFSADKSFQRDDLADSAVRLEAQIKKDAGAVVKPAATLRREVDAAFQKNDLRGGMQLLGQIVATAPNDASSWLQLARTIRRIWTPV